MNTFASIDNLSLLASSGLAFFGILTAHSLLQQDISNGIVARAEKEVVHAPKWLARNKTRSAAFVLNALYHHAIIKGRKGLHGLGGLVALVLSFGLTVWTLVTGGCQRGPPVLAEVMAIGVIILCLGFFTQHMRKKMTKLGKHSLIFYSFSALSLSFAVGANSIYAKAKISSEDFMQGKTQMFTTLSVALPVLSLVYLAQAMIQDACWISRNPFITYSTTLGYFYGPYFYESLLGRLALIELYSTTRAGDVVYFLHVSALLVTLIDVMALVLVLGKVFTLEQTARMAGYMWIVYGTFVIGLLTVALGPSVALGYVLVCGSFVPFHRVFPVRDLEENQSILGIFVGEHGGNNLGIGIKGSGKKC